MPAADYSDMMPRDLYVSQRKMHGYGAACKPVPAMTIPFWERFVGKTVVIEYRAWTGQCRFIAYHVAGSSTPVWLELQTLAGVTLFVDSKLLDVIREPVTEDYVGHAGLSMISLIGMLSDDRGYAEPPDEGDGDTERVESDATQ